MINIEAILVLISCLNFALLLWACFLVASRIKKLEGAKAQKEDKKPEPPITPPEVPVLEVPLPDPEANPIHKISIPCPHKKRKSHQIEIVMT